MEYNKPKPTFDGLPDMVVNIHYLLTEIANEISGIKSNFQTKAPAENMTRKEVAEFLKCDESTVHNWAKKGKLKKYAIGNRAYYKRHEVEAALINTNTV